MMSLNQLQAQFALALRYQGPADNCDINSDHFSADERMQIYRNNFVLSLSEVLEACYPITMELVGEECFQAMARQHITEQPPESGNVMTYGEGFVETVSQLDNIVSAVPYLTDVMALEWLVDDLNRSSEAAIGVSLEPLINMERVANVLHGNLVFHVKPQVHIIESDYAIASLFHAIHQGNIDNLNIHQPEIVLVAKTIPGSPLIYTLSATEYELLCELRLQKPLNLIESSLLTGLANLFELEILAGFTLLHEDDVRSSV
ncbi:DNA-binding domain-containing protein [Vibrio parahaemolyticus]|uniref:HvfC/BufC N-terminal domain-containing protein n=1 Tax=Vibrio mediterranei TaxID=689 RepID=UPI004068DE51